MCGTPLTITCCVHLMLIRCAGAVDEGHQRGLLKDPRGVFLGRRYAMPLTDIGCCTVTGTGIGCCTMPD